MYFISGILYKASIRLNINFDFQILIFEYGKYSPVWRFSNVGVNPNGGWKSRVNLFSKQYKITNQMLRFQGLKKGYLKAKGRKVILKNGLLQGNPEGSKKYNQWGLRLKPT